MERETHELIDLAARDDVGWHRIGHSTRQPPFVPIGDQNRHHGEPAREQPFHQFLSLHYELPKLARQIGRLERAVDGQPRIVQIADGNTRHRHVPRSRGKPFLGFKERDPKPGAASCRTAYDVQNATGTSLERTALKGSDCVTDGGGYGMRLIETIIEDDSRRGSFGHNGALILTGDDVLHAEAAAADPNNADADVNRIRKGDLAAVVARERRQDRPDPFRLIKLQEPHTRVVGDPGRLEPAKRHGVVDVSERVLVAPLDSNRDHDRELGK
jgi:hypothetical protein